MGGIAIRVLFLCTGNSARSQMAEALLRLIGGPDFDVESAGTRPRGVHPLAVEVILECGIDISQAISKPVDGLTDRDWDYIITLCDRADAECPAFPGAGSRLHWGFADPATVTGRRERQLEAFRITALSIAATIEDWVRDLRSREGQPLAS